MAQCEDCFKEYKTTGTKECKVCGGKIVTTAKFECRPGDFKLSEKVIMRIEPWGGYRIRIHGKPPMYPKTIESALKWCREAHLSQQNIDSMETLLEQEKATMREIRAIADEIIRQCPELKR